MNYDLDNTMMGKLKQLRDVTKERDDLAMKLAKLTEAAKIMVSGFSSDYDRTIVGYYALIEALNNNRGSLPLNLCGEIKASFQGEMK